MEVLEHWLTLSPYPEYRYCDSRRHTTHHEKLPSSQNPSELADDHGLFVKELVFGDFEVVRGGATSNTSTAVIVGAVAGAEPSMEVTGVCHRHASQMGAHSQAYDPLQHQNAQA